MRSAEDPVLMRNAGELANELIYTYPFNAESESGEAKKFTKKFEAKYNAKPDAYSAEGYEGFKLTALAFIECGKDNECIKDYLTNLKDYESVFGSLSFDENGDVEYKFFMKTVRNGSFVVLE
ncbi:MAG: ABC transporter substrate-binding protein [Nanoarchaeota archaeon]